MLFSHKKISDLIDPALQTRRKALERHHLFPRAWLEQQQIEDRRSINQMANYALLEWPDNLDISDTPPATYVPEIRKRFANGEWEMMCEAHALPANWEHMDFEEFLRQRRGLMAAIVRRGFDKLR